jgi:carboxypeptidase family protein
MRMRPTLGFPLAFAAVAVLLSSSEPAFSQETAGGLQGLVEIKSDKSPLPGVSVEAVHVPTGTRYMAVTTATGQFNILNVRAGGPYEVTAKISGFRT